MKAQHFLTLLALSFAALIAEAADLVVIANPAAGALTKEQVADIFLGKDQSLTPIDQSPESSIYAEFYKKASGRDLPQVKATWSRIIFSGKGVAPKQLRDAGEVKKAVAADPKALGYIDKSAVDGTVKTVLTLE